MSVVVAVRGVAVTEGNTGTTGYDIAAALPDHEVGDSLYAFYAGEWQETDTDSGTWVRQTRKVSAFQSGALFTRVATGTTDDDLTIGINPEGAGDYAIIVIATVGRTYLELLGDNAQTSTPSGTQFAAEDFDVNGSANPGNRVLHFLSAENPYYSDPAAPGTLLAPLTHGEWDGAVAGVWASTAVADDDPDTLHLPQRSASYWLSARVYQAVVTYSEVYPRTLERTGGTLVQQGDGFTSATFNSMGYASVHTPTATHGELPSSSVLRGMQDNAANLNNRDSSVFPYFGDPPSGMGVSFGTDTEHLPGDTSTDHWYEVRALTNRLPIEVHRRNVPGTDLGVLMWAPPDTETPPDGAIGWEWLDDPNDHGSREAVLNSVILRSRVAEDAGPPNLSNPVNNKTALIYQNEGYTLSADGDGTVRMTAWTPDNSTGAGTLESPDQLIEVDLTNRLDANGDLVLWHKTPAEVLMPELPASDLDYSVPDTGSSLYYGWLTSLDGDDLVVTWQFDTPAFRWITGMTELTADLTWQRAHPRDPDGLGVSSGHRAWPRPRSAQASGRRAGNYR